MLIKVNAHKHHYGGTICSQPTRWRCGASDAFRQNKCAQGQPFCYDIALFGESDPRVRKPGNVYDKDGYLTDMADVLREGDHPLLFFYTSTPSNAHQLVGLYVVGAVEPSPFHFNDEYDIRPLSGMAIHFDDPELTNEFLYRHSIGTEYYSRAVAETYLPTGLNEILRRQRMLLDECRRRGEQAARVRLLEQNVERLAEIITRLGHVPEAGEGAPEETAATDAAGGVGPADAVAAAAFATPSAGTVLPAGRSVPGSAASFTLPDLVNDMNRVLEAVRARTRAQGLYYPEDLVKRYHLSLLTKPFVIFAGVSGGGKTQLAMAYAEALGARLAVISVGPNWTANESLLGAYDVLNRRFVPTEFTEFLLAAGEEYRQALSEGREATPYCVVLDEMNLSHVEYYFSDFLSKMELPAERRQIALHGYEDPRFPQTVILPPNLLITGTVNVDETTHRFSPKVLDRANFIRLDDINLQEMLGLIDAWQPAILNKEQAREVTAYLRSINTVLLASQQHFGYRTAREIIAWVDRATCSGAFSLAQALDLQLLQKVLVKVQGSKFNPTERAMIQGLVVFFEDTTDTGTQQPLFPQSLAQIRRMQKALNEEEFTFGQQ